MTADLLLQELPLVAILRGVTPQRVHGVAEAHALARADSS